MKRDGLNKARVNNSMRMKSSQREIRPIWNNVQRVNHKNHFVPIAVLTRTGKILVNTARASGTNKVSTARHDFNRQAILTNTAMKVKTVKPIVNRVNTAEVNAVSAIGEKGKLLLSPQHVVIGDKKDITGKISPNRIVDQDYPHGTLKHKEIIDSGCSKHMTGNKAYLAAYQDFNGGPICDKKNKVLFTDSECLVLSPKFKLPDENQNREFFELCGSKGIKREYSNARTPQQNGVAKRKNKTLIEAARTMLADSFLPNTFWAESEFDEKSDEGFLVGYSLQSKAFRVYNLETKRVEENLHITFLENKPNIAGKGPTWLFDLDYLTDSMNYQPARSENQANKHAGPQEANHNAGTKDNIDAGDSEKEDEFAQDYFVLPIWSSYSSTENDADEAPNKHTDLKTDEKLVDKEDQVFLDELERLKRQEKDAIDAAETLRKEFAQETEDFLLQAGAAKASSTNTVNTVSTPGEVADFTNLETVVNVSPIPTSRINSIHPSTLILGDPQSAVQTKSKVSKSFGAHAFFKIQKVWILVDLPYGKKAIGTKWVCRNKKDERGVMVRNKPWLVAQGHRQEEGIDYDEVFAPVGRIEAIRIFLAFASYMGFIVYQMDVKSAFLYGKIDVEIYVSQPLGFIDPKYPQKVYKVVKALYGQYCIS
ncbi:putative ribonuclease H-like domain-containing protein [Tanacetum coccineum]